MIATSLPGLRWVIQMSGRELSLVKSAAANPASDAVNPAHVDKCIFERGFDNQVAQVGNGVQRGNESLAAGGITLNTRLPAGCESGSRRLHRMLYGNE